MGNCFSEDTTTSNINYINYLKSDRKNYIQIDPIINQNKEMYIRYLGNDNFIVNVIYQDKYKCKKLSSEKMGQFMKNLEAYEIDVIKLRLNVISI